jgi:unsaturated rhamnogalacturonyl hydrolase
MADSEMARRGDKQVWKQGGNAKWDYSAGLFTLSLLKLDRQVPDPRYVQFSEAAIGSFIASDGTIHGYKTNEFQLDSINSGKTALALYQLNHEERYRKAAELLRRQLDSQPRTSEGGFWHKQRYPHQMWLDGIYMASPFYAEYGRLFHEPAAFDDVAKQIRLVAAHTYDPVTGLFYHGWDESKQQDWANKTTGVSSNFWGRAIGWYGMALVDVLDFFPANHPARPDIIALLQKLSAGVIKNQDPASGLWYQVVDQGGRQGNYLEATASSMFIYTLAKGVNQGYLSRDCVPALLKGYQGLVEKLVKVDEQGRVSLTQCCSVAGLGYGRDGSYEYYLKEPIINNDLKGVGPFILAGIELQQLTGSADLPAGILPAVTNADGKAGAAGGAHAAAAPEWTQVPEILARIHAPQFPAREFSITDFGASTDGKSDSSAAIGKAVEACSKAGGGRVVVPAGEFLTGPIRLRSNVELHLEGGATLKFKTDPNAYLPAVFSRFEGMECYNYSPLIYAFGQENIAVTGEGTLDGQAGAGNWWSWKGKTNFGWKAGAPSQLPARARLAKMVDQGLPVAERRFGAGDYLRPNFFEPYQCRNVLIEGVHIRRSPMWEINPVLCTNVIVRGLDIASLGPNNDGCDPESCRDVLIEDCLFSTGDDCIAIKSGRNNDGRRVGVSSENLIIRHCHMKDGHAGVAIGSEVSGGCRNVFVEDCQMDSPNLERVLRLKSNAVRGGFIESIFMRNVTVGQVADSVLQIDLVYEEGANGPYKPLVRNVVMDNITVSHTPRILDVVGFPGAEISGVRICNSTFKEVTGPDTVTNASDVKLIGCAGQPVWQSLFNGRDLSGWVSMNDGVFIATNSNIRLVKGHGWLRTERQYTNFVFEAEWRALHTNYNSGFFLRAGLDGKPFPTDVWQVNLKETSLGSLLKGSPTVQPSTSPSLPINQWFTFRMDARGNKLILDINGRRAWEFNQFDAPYGYLGLQAEGHAFDFRNLRVRDLPAEAP